MSKNREHNIIAAVACPACGAGVGRRCEFNRAWKYVGHLTVHTERKTAWQQEMRRRRL